MLQGGSYIKGTDTQVWSDVDIVLFSEAFENLEDCKKKLPEVIDDLGKRLKKSSWASRFESKWLGIVSVSGIFLMLDVTLPSQDELYRSAYSAAVKSQHNSQNRKLAQDKAVLLNKAIAKIPIKDLNGILSEPS